MTPTETNKIPAKISKGELIIPPNVVEFLGVAHFEKLREKAKKGLAEMEANDRIGGDPAEDELPFSDEELMTEDGSESPAGFAEGGLAWASPEVTGLTNTGVETKIYVGPDGTKLPILFMGGQPIQQIPQGYVLEGEAKEAEASFKSVRPTIKNNTGDGDSQNLNTMQAKPTSEWGVEDFEKYVNSQGMMNILTKLPAIIGPGGIIMGGLMSKAYQAQGKQALKEIDERLQMPDLDAQSKERLTAVRGRLTEETDEKKQGGLFGGLFGGDGGLLGGLMGGEGNIFDRIFGGGVKTTSEQPRTPISGASRATTPIARRESGSSRQSPTRMTSSPIPRARPTTPSTVGSVARNTTAPRTADRPAPSVQDTQTTRGRGVQMAEGGFVKRRDKTKAT